jgi:CRISPR-associated protein Cas2
MFAVLTASAIPDHLHGYISRFLTRADTGVYVGTVTPRITDQLWDAVQRTIKDGNATLVVSSNNTEHGYDVRLHGTRRTAVRDFDGLPLVVTLLDNPGDGRTDTVHPSIAPHQ